MHMVMTPLTLHFTKGKFLMFLISQDIFMILIQSMRKPRVNDICISTGHFMAILIVVVVVTS